LGVQLGRHRPDEIAEADHCGLRGLTMPSAGLPH
jgi:hypothetical protein